MARQPTWRAPRAAATQQRCDLLPPLPNPIHLGNLVALARHGGGVLGLEEREGGVWGVLLWVFVLGVGRDGLRGGVCAVGEGAWPGGGFIALGKRRPGGAKGEWGLLTLTSPLPSC